MKSYKNSEGKDLIVINNKGKNLIETLEVFEHNEVITNPYSGRSCELTPIAVALYDFVKGCEMLGHVGEEFRLALMIFRLNFPEEYYVLLD